VDAFEGAEDVLGVVAERRPKQVEENYVGQYR
jgi:hypothetical protein